MPKIKPFDYNQIKKETPRMQLEIPGVKTIELKGEQGPEGKPGPSVKTTFLIKVIRLLIPEYIPDPIPGEPGKDYILTERDKEEIASKIKPTVVEKVVEKTEVIKHTAVKDKPEAIRDKLESLEKGSKLSIQAIEGLPELINKLTKKNKEDGKKSIGLLNGAIHTSKSKEIRFIDDETPSGTINGSNTAFTLTKTPLSGSLKVYRGGARQRVTEDYTISGKIITFTLAPQVGEVLLCDYRY